MAVPTKDTDLVPYSANWATRLATGYANYGLSEDQSEAFLPLQTAYLAAYNIAMSGRNAGLRSRPQTIAKDLARDALVANMRVLYGVVQSSPAVSEMNKALLGIADRSPKPAPIPAPTQRPSMAVLRAFGRTVVVSIYDPQSKSKRAKLPTAASAFVYSYVGVTYPSDPTLWQFCGAATKNAYDVVFADSVPSGSTVWICCAWATRRGDVGPASMPITANLAGGGQNEAAMKIAA